MSPTSSNPENAKSEIASRVARAVRREREAAGLSVSELSRRAGISKATVSQLEAHAANPSVETLWAIATALGVPFASFIADPSREPTLIRASEANGIRSATAPYEALLLSAGAPNARRDLYLLRAEPGNPRRSAPHSPGTTEHLVVISGRALAGPAASPFELDPGDYLSYPGDAPHVFDALEPATTAVLVSELR